MKVNVDWQVLKRVIMLHIWHTKCFPVSKLPQEAKKTCLNSGSLKIVLWGRVYFIIGSTNKFVVLLWSLLSHEELYFIRNCGMSYEFDFPGQSIEVAHVFCYECVSLFWSTKATWELKLSLLSFGYSEICIKSSRSTAMFTQFQ